MCCVFHQLRASRRSSQLSFCSRALRDCSSAKSPLYKYATKRDTMAERTTVLHHQDRWLEVRLRCPCPGTRQLQSSATRLPPRATVIHIGLRHQYSYNFMIKALLLGHATDAPPPASGSLSSSASECVQTHWVGVETSTSCQIAPTTLMRPYTKCHRKPNMLVPKLSTKTPPQCSRASHRRSSLHRRNTVPHLAAQATTAKSSRMTVKVRAAMEALVTLQAAQAPDMNLPGQCKAYPRKSGKPRSTRSTKTPSRCRTRSHRWSSQHRSNTSRPQLTLVWVQARDCRAWARDCSMRMWAKQVQSSAWVWDCMV